MTIFQAILLLTALLVSTNPGYSDPAGAQYSKRYTVRLSARQMPVLLDYEKAAQKLDRDNDKVLSAQELSVSAKDLPGDLRVDLDDYTLGLAHEFTGTPSSFVHGYPSAAEVEKRLRQISDAYPEQVRLVVLGPTPEGRDILALRVTAPGEVERPKLAVVAQQHAREWMAHQVALASLKALLEDPGNADLLETFEFWFVPLANPDGYEYSRLVDPMWRKNRRQQPSWPDGPRGVDLNRNFPADFRRQDDSSDRLDDDWGASDRPYSGVYRGAQAASEPETRELQSLLDLPGMVGVVDLHGFGCKVVLPNEMNVSEEIYLELAQSMVEAMGPDYEVLRYRDLYPITGHLAAYADLRGVAGITLEVGKAFQPNPTKIKEVADIGTRGVMAFARTMMGLRPPTR